MPRPEQAPGGDRPHVQPPVLADWKELITGSVPVSRIVLWTGSAVRRAGSHDRITTRQGKYKNLAPEGTVPIAQIRKEEFSG